MSFNEFLKFLQSHLITKKLLKTRKYQKEFWTFYEDEKIFFKPKAGDLTYSTKKEVIRFWKAMQKTKGPAKFWTTSYLHKFKNSSYLIALILYFLESRKK